MNSYLTEDFLECFRQLPQDVKEKTHRSYRFWKQNPNHPSLQFKRVHTREPIYAVRVGIGWRVLDLGIFVNYLGEENKKCLTLRIKCGILNCSNFFIGDRGAYSEIFRCTRE